MIMVVNYCIEIQQPVKEVFAFVSNAANLLLYDKNIKEVGKITSDPISNGTIFHLISRQFGINMTVSVEYIVYEPSHHFAYRVLSGPFPVETHYIFEGHANNTRVSGEREPQPEGIWKWLIPLISLSARKKFEGELNNLKKYLESH